MTRMDKVIKDVQDFLESDIYEMAAHSFGVSGWYLVFYNVKIAGSPMRVELKSKVNKIPISFTRQGFDLTSLDDDKIPADVRAKVESILKKPAVLHCAVSYWTDPDFDQRQIDKAIDS